MPNMGHRWVVAVDTGIAPQVQHSHANCVPCIVRRANSKGQGGCRTWDCPAGSHSLPPGCPKLIRGTAGNLLPRHLLGNHRTGFHTPRRGGMNQKHTTHNRQANVRLGHGSPIGQAGHTLPPDHTGNKHPVPHTVRPNNRCNHQAMFLPNQSNHSRLPFGMVHCRCNKLRTQPR